MTNSSFKTVPVNLVGPTSEHRDISYSDQLSMNLIPELPGTGASKGVLINWYGSKPFVSFTDGDRGVRAFNSAISAVNGQTLYTVDEFKTKTTIGPVTGAERCILDDNGSSLIITTGSKWYVYDGATVSEFTPPTATPAFVPGNSVAFLSEYAIYDVGGGRFLMSDFGAPTQFQTNNFATVQGELKRVFVFNERAYMMSDESITTWYLSTGNPPLRKTQGGTMEVGLKDVHSVAATQTFVYFRGTTGLVYRFSGTQSLPVTSGAIANKIQDYPNDSSVAYTINIDGSNYYVINFTQDNKTYVFSEKMNELSPGINDWFSLSTGDDEDRYIGEFYTKAFNRRFITDKATGSILELDQSLFTDDGDISVRERVIAPINGGLLGKEGARIEMSWFQLVMKKGVGTASGTGVDPCAYFAISIDGGDSWTNDEDVKIGRTGESTIKVTWYKSISFYECSIRIRIFDPVFTSLKSAGIGLKLLGD